MQERQHFIVIKSRDDYTRKGEKRRGHEQTRIKHNLNEENDSRHYAEKGVKGENQQSTMLGNEMKKNHHMTMLTMLCT